MLYKYVSSSAHSLRRSATAHIGTVAEECTIAAEKQLRATVKQCTIDSVRATATIAAKYSDASISRLLDKNDALRRRTEENQRLIEILQANKVVLEKENLRQHEVRALQSVDLNAVADWLEKVGRMSRLVRASGGWEPIG